MFTPWTRNWATRTFDDYPGMNVFSYQLRPESAGSVLIESADPSRPLQISPNYLATQRDRDLSVSLVRSLRKLMATKPISGLVTGETGETIWPQSAEEILELFMTRGALVYIYCGTPATGPAKHAGREARLRVWRRGARGWRPQCIITDNL